MPTQPRWTFRSASRLITRLEIGVGAVLLLTIFILMFVQAAQRHLPMDSLAWTGEVSRFSLAWLTFLMAGVLVTERGHITLEVLDTVPNQHVVRGVQAFALLVVAATAGLLVHEAWSLVETQGIMRSPVLGLPMSWVYAPLLVGMVSTVIRSVISAVDIALHGPVLPEISDENDLQVSPS